jgi:hypothetical protein
MFSSVKNVLALGVAIDHVHHAFISCHALQCIHEREHTVKGEGTSLHAEEGEFPTRRSTGKSLVYAILLC